MRLSWIARSLLLPGVLLLPLTACAPFSEAPMLTEVPAAAGASPDLQVWFTDPAVTGVHGYQGGPDEALAQAIDQARQSVDMAAYSFNLWSLRDALLAAAARGVVVRVVMESDNMGEQEIWQLVEAGIPVVGDGRQGLMHDKFVVIDNSEVWTGSMNFTVGGAYWDNNDLVCLRSEQAAEDYTTEFEEMFTEDLFGEDIRPATPYRSLTIDGIPLEVYFSPDDGVAARLLELVRGARQSIYFLAYSFTNDDLGQAIRERAAAGVAVAGVMDLEMISSNQGSEYDPFRQAGLDIRPDGNAGLMHHKVMILDGEIVVTGSYNFTASAEERNDENLLVIRSSEVADQYMDEFQRVYAQARP